MFVQVIEGRCPIVKACAGSAIPCLLTEIVVAGGFLSLIANDMVMIQQFGVVTAAVWERFATAEPGADFTRIFPFVEGS